MKLTATVMGERPADNYVGGRTKPEPYAVADVLVDGEAGLIASSLRALADAIDPQSPARFPPGG